MLMLLGRRSASDRSVNGGPVLAFLLTFAALTSPALAGTVSVFNVKDYGALGNGTVDDHPSIQLAQNALAAAGGGTLYFPPGVYLVGGEVSITVPATVAGEGPRATTIRTTFGNTTSNIFRVALSNSIASAWLPVVFRDLALDSSLPHTTGAGISYSSAPQWSDGLRLENVRFEGRFVVGLYIGTAAAFVVDKCFFGGALSHDILIDNTINSDVNDGVISNSYFFSNGFSAILHIGGGGLKVLGNKFRGYQVHYYNAMSLGPATQPTGILHFANNSSEFATIANLQFWGSEIYEAILIQNNDFSIAKLDDLGQPGSCPQTTSGISVSPTPGGTNPVGVISGNIFRGYVAGAACTAIAFTPSATGGVADWMVAGNVFNFVPRAILVGAGALRVEVGENKYSFVTTKVENHSASSGPMLTIQNNSFVPPGLSDGGVLFVQGGALKFRGGNGTVTTIAIP